MSQYSTYFSELLTVSACLEKRDELANSGSIFELKDKLKLASNQDKKLLGRELNTQRQALFVACDQRIQEIQIQQEQDNFVSFDPTFYSAKYQTTDGALHPITLVIQEIAEIFGRLGFDVFEGSDVETQWNNFTSANSPDYHPSRDMMDTFWLDLKDSGGENYVMRTQVTANAVKYAQTHKPPFRTLFIGRTYRNENIDATHDINFTQFDMWLVDKKASVSQLVTLLKDFFTEFFQDSNLQIRLRPSYFPFVQPAFEIDIFSQYIKGGKWVEVLGAGPIHTLVLNNMHLDPNEWQGIAFGGGIDRLVQLKLGLRGISQFYAGHVDFLRGN